MRFVLYGFVAVMMAGYAYMWFVDPRTAIGMLPLLLAPAVAMLLASLYVRWLKSRADKNSQNKKD